MPPSFHLVRIAEPAVTSALPLGTRIPAVSTASQHVAQISQAKVRGAFHGVELVSVFCVHMSIHVELRFKLLEITRKKTREERKWKAMSRSLGVGGHAIFWIEKYEKKTAINNVTAFSIGYFCSAQGTRTR